MMISTASTGHGCLLRACIFLLLLIASLVQIMFFMLLPNVQIHSLWCHNVSQHDGMTKMHTADAMEAITSAALRVKPMKLFFQSLYLSPQDVGFREREQARLEERKKSQRIRGDNALLRAEVEQPDVDREPELPVKKGFFLQTMGQGHEPIMGSSSAYCINLIVPSNESRILQDLEVYANALPSSRPIQVANERDTIIVPPSVIDIYLERHPIDAKYYQDFHFPKDKTIWIMQNVEFFDRHELKHPNVGVMIVKNRIGLQKVLEYRLRHRLQYSVLYTKHTSPDLYNPALQASRDWNAVLHIATASSFTNTMAVVQAWTLHPKWPTLHLDATVPSLCQWIEETLGLSDDNPAPYHQNIKYQCDGDELLRASSTARRMQLLNSIGMHLYPSETEGFGHLINEARSTGAMILTSDVAPMNELVVDGKSGYVVGKAREWWWQTKGDLFMPLAHVQVSDIEDGITRILESSIPDRQRMGKRARAMFLHDRTYFLNAMAAIEESLCQDEIRIDKLQPYLY